MTRAKDSAGPATPPWSPFRHAAFTVLWIATVVANVGSWMYNAASGWLMTSSSLRHAMGPRSAR
jgi:Transmembrane secretion effector